MGWLSSDNRRSTGYSNLVRLREVINLLEYRIDGLPDPNLQSTIKDIPRGAMFVTIHQRDLLTPSQAPTADDHPNADSNIASVRLPIRATVASVFDDKYWKLVILSKKL